MSTREATLSRSTALRLNIRDYGMYIVFVVILVAFTIATEGLFLSSRNIVNLVNAVSYIAILAVGMTLVIVIRHIDLSVGYLVGFLGAVAAYCLTIWNWPVVATIPLVLLLGLLAGLFTSVFVAFLRIPAFVATLAGWLLYRGLLELVTIGTGTIIISDPVFNALGNGFIPDIPVEIIPGVHTVTLLIGIVAIIAYIWSEVSNRRKTLAYNFEVAPMNLFIIKLVFVSAVIAGATWVLAGYRGLSWAAVVLLIVVLVYSYITTKTVVGRHIYAVGGNPEAADLNGISVRNITILVFGSMGFLAAVAGILYASWLRSATTIAGQGMELDAIAAAFVGGVAVSGGVGKVTGSILGALVMASLTNGMRLLGWPPSTQYIVRAFVLLFAVVFDVLTRRQAT